MNMALSVVIGGIAGVLLLDTFGSLAAKQFGFSYGSLAPVSFAIWIAVGALIGRIYGISGAFLASAFVGFVEATVGWRISWIVGPGQWSPERTNTTGILRTVARVTLLAGVLGLSGGAIASRV
jgi:hypothetical protein